MTGTGSGFQLRAGNGNIVTWPHDGDYYEFWVDGSADGRFTIPNVRPGTYVLRAFAKGVLGEYDRTAKITVEAGKKIDLGKLDWQPVRFGKQIWEIGYPDRTADKFFKGDGANYWLWGWGLRYSRTLPQRHHLHHRQEQLPQGLVLPGGAALHHHRMAESRCQGPLQPALRLGSNPSYYRGPVAAVGPRAGHHMDCQVQHAEGLAGYGSPAYRAGWG